jgi:hypothetical protein
MIQQEYKISPELITTSFKDLGMNIASFMHPDLTIRECYLMASGSFGEYLERLSDEFVIGAFIMSFPEIKSNLAHEYDMLVDDTFEDTAKAFYISAAHGWCMKAIKVVYDLIEDGSITPLDEDSNVVPFVKH